MKEFFILCWLCPLLLFAQSAENITPLSIGESFTVNSEVLGEERRINVYLPTYYQYDSLKTYPVIYLLDGSMDEDFVHISGLVQFCSFSWINDMPETIVVGIGNVDRKRDFTFPTRSKKDKKEFPTTGGSAKFIDFLKLELPDVVNGRYRTNGVKTIVGQSLGGLLASEILFKQPELFDNYVIISPSLWWDDQSLLKHDLPEAAITKSVYVGVGAEGKVMETDARSLYDLLKVRSSKAHNLHFGFFSERDHGDTLHEAAYAAFQQLFKNKERLD